MFQNNCLTQGILIDSPMYSSPGSHFQIRITPRIFKKFEIVSGSVYWDHRKLFTGKNKRRKISRLCPFRLSCFCLTQAYPTKPFYSHHKLMPETTTGYMYFSVNKVKSSALNNFTKNCKETFTKMNI